jgi:hypothetical protein
MNRWLFFLGIGLVCLCLSACARGKFESFPDAAPPDRTLAERLWADYLKVLSDPALARDPLLAARLFSRQVLLQVDEADFQKRLLMFSKRRSALDGTSVKALKNTPDGLVLVIESKAGEVGIPVLKEGDGMRFAEITASTGEWSKPAKALPASASEPSLLSIKVLLRDENADVGERLRAAVALAQSRERAVIVSAQKTVQNPIVRQGLALARVKLDGSDESFLKNFPTDAEGLRAIQRADSAIFEEMLTKLSNMGALVEEPPANEILFRVAAGAPPEMRARMGRALYDMAELGPARFANAFKNLVKDPKTDPALALYAEEFRQKKDAPKLQAFLKKFAAEGASEEQKLCRSILAWLQKIC